MTFKDVSDMFDNLLKKGYTVQEIMKMPIEVGKKIKEIEYESYIKNDF